MMLPDVWLGEGERGGGDGGGGIRRKSKSASDRLRGGSVWRRGGAHTRFSFCVVHTNLHIMNMHSVFFREERDGGREGGSEGASEQENAREI